MSKANAQVKFAVRVDESWNELLRSLDRAFPPTPWQRIKRWLRAF